MARWIAREAAGSRPQAAQSTRRGCGQARRAKRCSPAPLQVHAVALLKASVACGRSAWRERIQHGCAVERGSSTCAVERERHLTSGERLTHRCICPPTSTLWRTRPDGRTGPTVRVDACGPRCLAGPVPIGAVARTRPTCTRWSNSQGTHNDFQLITSSHADQGNSLQHTRRAAGTVTCV